MADTKQCGAIFYKVPEAILMAEANKCGAIFYKVLMCHL